MPLTEDLVILDDDTGKQYTFTVKAFPHTAIDEYRRISMQVGRAMARLPASTRENIIAIQQHQDRDKNTDDDAATPILPGEEDGVMDEREVAALDALMEMEIAGGNKLLEVLCVKPTYRDLENYPALVIVQLRDQVLERLKALTSRMNEVKKKQRTSTDTP